MQSSDYSENIITGEKIQQLCDIYLGLDVDFEFNPVIHKDKHKHINLNEFNEAMENPKMIFCYTYRLRELSEKIHFFHNEFILITHNSDMNIINCDLIDTILSCKKLIKWYAQNVCYDHPKLHLIPIGLANSMWKHGDLSFFTVFNTNTFLMKTKNIYFNFDISTNTHKRLSCYDCLKDRVQFLPFLEPYDNLNRLVEYKFAVCPEGNGADTHRLWESLYLRVVPIVINSEFVQILKKYGVPLVILNDWSELDETKLNYNDYHFENQSFIELSQYKQWIEKFRD